MKNNLIRRYLIISAFACGLSIGGLLPTDSLQAQSKRILPPQLPGPSRSSNPATESNASGLPPALPSIGGNNTASPNAPAGTEQAKPDFAPLRSSSQSNVPASLSSPQHNASQQDLGTPLKPSFGQDNELPSGLSNNQVMTSGVAKLELCTVRLIQQIELPASEPGVLAELLGAEGMAVSQGQVVAKVDDERAKTELSVAAAKLEASQLKTQSDIEIRYAQAGYDAAAKKYERESRLARKGVGTESEADEARLQAIQAQLQIEKAQHDFSVDQKAITVEKLQVLQAKELLRRHSVTAPWGGIIRKVLTHQGEWVNAGDPIVEMIQMDRLWVEGLVNLKQINPYQVPNRPVVVTMKLADGEAITFQGKIVFVDPEVNGNIFKVKAEVSNRMFQNHWLLIPGMKVDMNIDLLPVGAVDKLGQPNFQPRG